VPKGRALCDAFAALTHRARPGDRLPADVRDSGPLQQVTRSSARLLRSAAGHDVFIVGGRRLVCLVVYLRKRHEAAYGCSPPDSILRGQSYLEESCAPAPRKHRVLFTQLVPDGVRSAVLHRVGVPPIRRKVRRNLLLVDLRVPSRDYLPTRVQWRRRGRLRTLGLPVDEEQVTCRPPSPPARVLR
jgi:hypothetical protein